MASFIRCYVEGDRLTEMTSINVSLSAGPGAHAIPFQLNLTVCSYCTGVPVHAPCILLPACTWRPRFNSTCLLAHSVFGQ